MSATSAYRDTWAEVDLSIIRDNVKSIKSRLPVSTDFIAVVKADGYGHGGAQIAASAIHAGADGLAVAYLSEALQLRRQGVTASILIMTPIRVQDVSLAIKHRLELTVASAEWLCEAMAYVPKSSKSKLRVHVKFDTGLGRIGIRDKSEWDALVPCLQKTSIIVEGVYTHFATAGRSDVRFLREQAAKFEDIKAWIKEAGISVRRYHCANSVAALRFPELAMDGVRIGAALYGLVGDDYAKAYELKPSLSLHSRLIHVKRIVKGQSVGYDVAYRAEEDEWIGTVPIGYADGWSQVLQGSEMLVGGSRAPIVGKIGMDQVMVRLSRQYPVGTLVTLIGSQEAEEVTCSELAAYLKSVPQELSVSLASRIGKLYKDRDLYEKIEYSMARV